HGAGNARRLRAADVEPDAARSGVRSGLHSAGGAQGAVCQRAQALGGLRRNTGRRGAQAPRRAAVAAQSGLTLRAIALPGDTMAGMTTRLLSTAALLFALSASALAAEHTKDSLDTVKQNLAAKKAVLIDVREIGEWKRGHLADARLVPLSEL